MSLTWVDAAEAMLEGARELPETSGSFWRDADGVFPRSLDEVKSACALGCAYYTLALRNPTSVGDLTAWINNIDQIAAADELRDRYWVRFGHELTSDNDHAGRDHVLGNVKQLLSEVQR